VPGIHALCRRFAAAGYAIVVVTNQAGIARGYYTEEQFHALTAWMRAQMARDGADVDAVYFCPDHPEHGIGRYRRDSFDRKPNPGMIHRARDELQLDLARSTLVGDKISDVEAAIRGGVGDPVLLWPQGAPPDLPSRARLVRSLDEVLPATTHLG